MLGNVIFFFDVILRLSEALVCFRASGDNFLRSITRTIAHKFWNHFEIILGSFWDHFGVMLGSFRDHFGIILGSFWDHFGIILQSFWHHFKIPVKHDFPAKNEMAGFTGPVNDSLPDFGHHPVTGYSWLTGPVKILPGPLRFECPEKH